MNSYKNQKICLEEFIPSRVICKNSPEKSFDLNREKVVSGKGKIIVFIGPLKPGIYQYFGDFHQNTAKGTIVVE